MGKIVKLEQHLMQSKGVVIDQKSMRLVCLDEIYLLTKKKRKKKKIETDN